VDRPDVTRAIAAATSVAASLGLPASDAVVLHNSNKLAVRLTPCDVLARVARAGQEAARLEVELAQRLTEAGCPGVPPGAPGGPACVHGDGFAVTLWTYYEPVTPHVPPAGYATAPRQQAQQPATGSRRPRGPRSSCSTASRIQAMCSARGTARCSSTLRRAAAGPSSSTSPMSRRRPASTTRALAKDCLTSAGSSFSRWSQPGAGNLAPRTPQSGAQIGSYGMLSLIMCDGLAGCEREDAGQPPSQVGCALTRSGPPRLPGSGTSLNFIVPWRMELCLLWRL